MSVRISRHKNSVKIAKYKVKAGEIIDDSPSFLLGRVCACTVLQCLLRAASVHRPRSLSGLGFHSGDIPIVNSLKEDVTV